MRHTDPLWHHEKRLRHDARRHARLAPRRAHHRGGSTRRAADRSGSVLVLAVALLVMMALIGTAYISTARTDRQDAAQNSYNTQVDLIAQGVLNAEEGELVKQVLDPTTGARSALSASYAGYDSYLTPPLTATLTNPDQGTDYFLAPRVPEMIGSQPGWATLSYPAMANTSAGTTWQFAEPLIATNPGYPGAIVLGNDRSQNSASKGDNSGGPHAWVVTSIHNRNGQDYPALMDVGNSPYKNIALMAGDADGDGRADSLFFKLPIGPINGVTYYGSIRVIDNSSAVNVNTALGTFTSSSGTVDTEYDTNSNRWPTIFPSSVGLDRLLIGGQTETGYIAGYISSPSAPAMPPPTSTIVLPLDDFQLGGRARNDFRYLTWGDAWWHCVGRRIDNPAYIPTTSGSSNIQFNPFGLTDAAGLASRFCIKSRSAGALEGLLYTSTQYAPTSPYTIQSAGVAGDPWFATNFDYSGFTGTGWAAAKTTPRTLLTTRNGVASLIVSHDVPTQLSGGTANDPTSVLMAPFPKPGGTAATDISAQNW